MKALLTSIGTRGDVQPLIALALKLRELACESVFCVPPNFKQWVESYGFEFLPYGLDVEQIVRQAASGKVPTPTAQQRRAGEKRIASLQFPILVEAARECDLMIVGGIPQIAARSVADYFGVPCIFAAYCPVVWPSDDHAPPVTEGSHPQEVSAGRNRLLWQEEAQKWNEIHREPLNIEREKIGLAHVDELLHHVFDGTVLLAADPMTMSPANKIVEGMHVVQSADWILPDSRSLPDDVQRFLDAGEPPIFFGCGSMRANANASRIFIESARTLGRRAIISQGWSGLQPVDDGLDCLFVDDISYTKLFPRVTAVVYHGSAGTMSAAARAGRPQVIIPHVYDQFYLASRVEKLGVGIWGPDRDDLNIDALTLSIHHCLKPEIVGRAAGLIANLELNGAQMAADWLVHRFT